MSLSPRKGLIYITSASSPRLFDTQYEVMSYNIRKGKTVGGV